ncbi:reverse transcriptase domain, reverse transcriptase zinc-binding domain protein [Tanacetum coccineum]
MKWVDSCLRSSSMSIIVNGSPTEKFRLERGVRQGDSLSPFLYILAAEGLNAMVSEAVEKGIFRENDKSLMCILKCFKEVSGLKVNYNKSKIYGIGVNMEEKANWMECGIGEFPFTYLGLLIGENLRRVKAWIPVVEKFKKRLADWKAKTMSFRGRLTLVKLVLVEAWGRVGLWAGGVMGVWRDIMKISEEIDEVGLDFTSSWGGVLGDGRDIMFWVDRWVDNRRLCDRFPRLYHLDRRKASSVSEKGSWVNEVWCWEWDKWRWSLREDGEFKVKDLSRMVEDKILNVDSGAQETSWNKLVPKKVNVFV